MSEGDAWSLEKGCRKAMLGVWRKGVGRRCLELGGSVPEGKALSLEEGCRKAMRGVWRKGVESEAWNVVLTLTLSGQCVA